MERILEAIKEKQSAGYGNNQLEVSFGSPDSSDTDKDGYVREGYFVAKLNGFGITPITGVLASDGEVDDNKLIAELDKLGIAY